MTDNDTVLELYNRGISAHDLRSSYVGDQLGDNPYIRFSRQKIEREKRELQGLSSLTGREMDEEFFDLHREPLEQYHWHKLWLRLYIFARLLEL